MHNIILKGHLVRSGEAILVPKEDPLVRHLKIVGLLRVSPKDKRASHAKTGV